MDILLKLIALIIGYFLGCFVSAYYLGKKINDFDIRQHGTFNPGSANVTALMGWKYGTITLIADLLKGFIAVWIIKLIMPEVEGAEYYAGAGAVLGHLYPYQLEFKGGKGVVTFVGAVIGLSVPAGLSLGALFVVLTLILNYVSVAGLFVLFIGPFLLYFEFDNFEISYLYAIVAYLGISKHRENIYKLRQGTEQGFKEFIYDNQDSKDILI